MLNEFTCWHAVKTYEMRTLLGPMAVDYIGDCNTSITNVDHTTCLFI